VLSTPISMAGIKTDAVISKYSSEAHQNEPDQENLVQSKHKFQQELIFEMFDFKLTKSRFDSLLHHVKENANSLESSLIRELQEKRQLFENEIFQISLKFRTQLTNLMNPEVIPEENSALQDRIKQAIVYFSDKIKIHLTSFFDRAVVETDNKAVKKTIIDSLEKLERESFIRLSCLKECQNGFVTIKYIKTRSGADVDFRSSAKQKATSRTQVAKNIPHPELYLKLKEWRDNLADEQNLPTYMILPQKSLAELVAKLPIERQTLKNIKGIGQAKIGQYGEEIIQMIQDYCIDYKISSVQTELKVKEKKTRNKRTR
jgi:superfamily II DNA helicase RecQ